MLCFSLAQCAYRDLWSTSGFAFRWPPPVDHTQDTLAFRPAVFPSNPCFSLAEPALLSTLSGQLIIHHLPRFQFLSESPSGSHPAILARPFECAASNRPNLHPVHSSRFLSSFLLSPHCLINKSFAHPQVFLPRARRRIVTPPSLPAAPSPAKTAVSPQVSRYLFQLSLL